jgi:hypothetical protein
MKCREEDKKQTYADAKISDEALQLERMIKDIKKTLKEN